MNSKFSTFPVPQSLWFFMLPMLYLTTGMILSLPYSSINFLALAILYLFALSNQTIEMVLTNTFIKKQSIRKNQLFFQEVVVIACLLFFIIYYSIYTPILLLCYSLVIQGKVLFKFYDLDTIAVVITVFFKAILLNAAAFYLQANFVSINSIQYFLPLVFPLLILELDEWGKPLRKIIEKLCWSLGYLLAILQHWPNSNWFNLVILLSIPLVLSSKINLSLTSKVVLFNLSYLILLLFSQYM